MTKRLEEWQRDAMRAVPDSLIRDIVRDSYRGPSQPSSLASRPGVPEEPPRPASGGTVPIQQPPGINYVDQLCDAADRRDRAALIRQQMENSWIESLLEESSSRVQSEYEPFSAENMKK